MFMGRPKFAYLGLPPHMTARTLASGAVLYYHQKNGKKTPLGNDLCAARLKWVEIENGPTGKRTFEQVAEEYRRDVLPGKGRTTQKQQNLQIDRLIKAMLGSFEDLAPMHVRNYMDRRTHKIAGNREISVLSHMWNWARAKGYTDKANPCAGVQRHTEQAREVYVSDTDFAACYGRATQFLRDAMDIALLTGQRPGDVLRMTRQDIVDGNLIVTQGKTKHRKTPVKLAIAITGELKSVIDRITAKQVASIGPLITDEAGQRVNLNRLDYEFRKAKAGAKWQFRDLRAKTASDSTDLKSAQRLLGHTTEVTTANIYRRTRGRRVDPLR